jgi:hypothetical protein
LLCAKLTETRRTGGRRRGWTHANLGEGGLVATMRGRLGRSVHWDGEVWLSHLLRELEVARCLRHLALHLEVTQMLLRLDHAHVNILLVCCSDLLLLLLQNLDLLCDGELFHCRLRQLCSHGTNGRYVLISGVSSDGLRRCAMCRRRPAGPIGPCWPCCC